MLECLLVGERGLGQDPNLALNLKLATRLLYGEDIRPDLPAFDRYSYVRSVIHTPYFSCVYPTQRSNTGHLTYPLQHISTGDQFLGYTQWAMPAADGTEQPSTRLLIASVGWTATAIVALRTGQYVKDKNACVDLYRTLIGDEWTRLVVEVHDLCRNRWHYRVPDSRTDQRTLRELCHRALAFQNHFLTIYREYQFAELACCDPERQALAIARLHQVVFRDEEVASALADAEASLKS